MASTKVVLIFNKAKKNKEVPLYLRIIKDRKPKYVSLQIAVRPEFWDEKMQCVKPKHPNAARMNSYIQHKKTEATDVILEMVTDSKYVPVKSLKNAVHGLSAIDFFKYAEAFIKKYEKNGQIGTHKRFKSVIEKMKDFVGKVAFTFDDMTIQFLNQYEENLKDKLHNGPNTIHANMKAIMRIVNEAINDEIFPIEKNPFLKYKIKWHQTEKIFLTEEEIKLLEDISLDVDSKKYHHRNMYIFACYVGGIRISDLITLKWENFSGNHILLKTHKTGSVISIQCPKKALKILELYKHPGQKKSDFIFPFLDKSLNLTDPKTLHNAISSITAYTNTDLEDISKLAGIDKHIHFHTSRHTWATRALRKGMRIEYVSKLMGHNSIRTTQVYAKIVNADLDKAMDVFDKRAPVKKKKAPVINEKPNPVQ